MGIGDRMFPDDGASLKMACGHNHPEQGTDKLCKLCGVRLPQLENEVKADAGRTEQDTG